MRLTLNSKKYLEMMAPNRIAGAKLMLRIKEVIDVFHRYYSVFRENLRCARILDVYIGAQP